MQSTRRHRSFAKLTHAESSTRRGAPQRMPHTNTHSGSACAPFTAVVAFHSAKCGVLHAAAPRAHEMCAFVAERVACLN